MKRPCPRPAGLGEVRGSAGACATSATSAESASRCGQAGVPAAPARTSASRTRRMAAAGRRAISQCGAGPKFSAVDSASCRRPTSSMRRCQHDAASPGGAPPRRDEQAGRQQARAATVASSSPAGGSWWKSRHSARASVLVQPALPSQRRHRSPAGAADLAAPAAGREQQAHRPQQQQRQPPPGCRLNQRSRSACQRSRSSRIRAASRRRADRAPALLSARSSARGHRRGSQNAAPPRRTTGQCAQQRGQRPRPATAAARTHGRNPAASPGQVADQVGDRRSPASRRRTDSTELPGRMAGHAPVTEKGRARVDDQPGIQRAGGTAELGWRFTPPRFMGSERLDHHQHDDGGEQQHGDFVEDTRNQRSPARNWRTARTGAAAPAKWW